MTRRRRRERVLLDTNVWRYVADAGALDRLRQAAFARNIRIQVAPSTVYEALRTGDAALRARLLLVMTHRAWARLMPEVRDEAHEFLTEVRRLRPEWITAQGNREWARRLQYDWVRSTGGFWDRARETPDTEAAALTIVEEDMLGRARAQAAQARDYSIKAALNYETVSLANILARPARPITGWDGNDLEPWRIAALSVVSSIIDSQDISHAFVEWLGNEVDLVGARSEVARWNRFWLYEVERCNMPRHWLRWAFEMLQSLRRVTDGTPCDAQLGTYLTQCDWFITGDKAFTDMVTKVGEVAPFAIGRPVMIPGGTSGVEALLRMLRSIGTS
jgi:hypothetical protein